MSRPDFFIVGAPKCGTTALHDYLGQHPEIFVSRVKEPTFFGSDLVRPGASRRTLDEYLALFADARSDQRVGESSTAYLSSLRAPAEIFGFNPASQVIAMLRNPIDVLHAYHSQLLYQGEEDIEDFGEALAAETGRRERASAAATPASDVRFYRSVVSFADQIARYLEQFGRRRVHVVIYDDFRQDVSVEFELVLRFLEVDPLVRPPSFATINPNKQPRIPALHRFLTRPPRVARRAALLVPARARQLLFGSARRLNTRHAARSPIPPDLYARLARELAPDVERLGDLLGRDLSHWTRM